MNKAQEATIRNLCERYNVEFDPKHYVTNSEHSTMMPLWTEGWIGGYDIQSTHPTIYVGVSPEGQAHS